MKLLGRLKEWSIDGGWGLSLLGEETCCQGGELSSDTILVSVKRTLLGTLRHTLSSSFSGLRNSRSVNYPLSGSVVYVVRLDKSGARRMARPCSNCMGILRKAGVKEVRYTTDDGWRREWIA